MRWPQSLLQLVGAEQHTDTQQLKPVKTLPPDEASGIKVHVKLTAFLLTGKCLSHGNKMAGRCKNAVNHQRHFPSSLKIKALQPPNRMSDVCILFADSSPELSSGAPRGDLGAAQVSLNQTRWGLFTGPSGKRAVIDLREEGLT